MYLVSDDPPAFYMTNVTFYDLTDITFEQRVCGYHFKSCRYSHLASKYILPVILHGIISTVLYTCMLVFVLVLLAVVVVATH